MGAMQPSWREYVIYDDHIWRKAHDTQSVPLTSSLESRPRDHSWGRAKPSNLVSAPKQLAREDRRMVAALHAQCKRIHD